jgi:hypothetical protein
LTWRRIATRLAISAFLVFHLTATLAWVIPDSPLKQCLMPVFRPYMLPLGLWQSWWIFAPDPMGETAVLESEVIDARGMRHIYEFPRVADLPWWKKLPRFRHPKFTCNLMLEEYATQRQFTGRYVLRQMGLPPEAYPVRLSLYCQIKAPPPPGQAFTDPKARARLYNVGTYDFVALDEVRP